MKLLVGQGVKYPKNYDFLYKKKYVTRAGIVPYMIDKLGDTYILLGRDNPSNKFADLGGTREAGETTLDAAIREFLEESRSVLSVDLNRTSTIIISKIDPKVNNSSKKQVILFPEIDLNGYHIEIDRHFQSVQPKSKYEDEMMKLEWIKLDEFLQAEDKELSKSLRQVKKILNNF